MRLVQYLSLIITNHLNVTGNASHLVQICQCYVWLNL